MPPGLYGRIHRAARRQSLTDFIRNDPDYRAAALERDRWFSMVTLGTVLTLGTTSMSMLFGFPLVVVVVPAAFFLYAFARFFVRSQRAAKSMRPWIEANPYHGPVPRLVGPLRNFTLHQPTFVGLTIAAVLSGLLILATFGRHHA